MSSSTRSRPKGEGGFDWTETSQEEADEGSGRGQVLRDPRDPEDFSKNLVSTGGDDPEQAGLQLRTDDAHNFIVGQVAGTVLTEIKSGLNKTTTAEYVSGGLRRVQRHPLPDREGRRRRLGAPRRLLELHDGTGSLVDGTTEARQGSRHSADRDHRRPRRRCRQARQGQRRSQGRCRYPVRVHHRGEERLEEARRRCRAGRRRDGAAP
jgi:hypothetical protein